MADYHYVVNGDGFHLGNVQKVRSNILTNDEVALLSKPENAHLMSRVIRVPMGSLPEAALPQQVPVQTPEQPVVQAPPEQPPATPVVAPMTDQATESAARAASRAAAPVLAPPPTPGVQG